jgi:hypothetical protein
MSENTPKKPNAAPERIRVVLLATLAAGALLFAALQARSEAKAPAAQDASFELDAWLGSNRCQTTASNPQELSRYAEQLQQMAHARMQRAVFVPSEAIRATSLLAEAALCLRQANDPSAADVHQQWLRWKSDLTTRLQGHRLRLDLALKSKRYASASTEIKALKALLSGIAPSASPESPLAKLSTWLDFQQRSIANQATKK